MNGHFCFVHDQRTKPALSCRGSLRVGAAAPRVGPLAGRNTTLIVLRLVGSCAQTAPAGDAQSEAIVCRRQAIDPGKSLINRPDDLSKLTLQHLTGCIVIIVTPHDHFEHLRASLALAAQRRAHTAARCPILLLRGGDIFIG
jgi:hypothetical protein